MSTDLSANASAMTEQNLDTKFHSQDDDPHLLVESHSRHLADDTSILLFRTRDKTTDTKGFGQYNQLEVLGGSILALNDDSHAIPFDLRQNYSFAMSTSLDTDSATPASDPLDADPLIPSSSPFLPSSSPPQIFSSSPFLSSQPSTSDYSSETSMDLKEELNSHKESTADCFSNSAICIEAETYPTSLSHLSALETPHSDSALARFFSGLPICNKLLNDDESQHISPELEPATNVDMREADASILVASLTPSSSSDAEIEGVEMRDVSTHEESTLRSFSENLSFRVDTKLTGSERMILPDEKAAFDKCDSSAKLERELLHAEAPRFDSGPSIFLIEHKIEDEDKNKMAVTSSKKRKHIHTIGSESSFPNPKRSTIAFQQLQHRKLISPFRPPTVTLCLKAMGPKSSVPESSLAYVSTPVPAERTLVPDDLNSELKHRTRRASTPFKSPLSTDAIRKLPAVRMTPTIQGLERKVQLLRRAIKIRDDGEEETLSKLVKKWTEAGRDIAWEVWDLVKENVSKDDRGWSSLQMQDSRTSTSKDSWYWDDEIHRQGKERNWGWDVEPERMAMDLYKNEVLRSGADDNDDKLQNTLGTMLTQLGISLETLGWNEEDEEFRDM